MILSIEGDKAKVDYGGVEREANISLVEVEEGDYVIVHAGYAIQTLDEEEARASLETWDELLKIEEGLEKA